jgi:hypothetical protein
MSSYVKPQVLVFQEFNIVPTEITEPLRAHIAGPHAVLHRHSNVDEKPYTFVGEYDRLHDTTYAWPQRNPGSRVDDMYTKVYIDNALLLYYNTAVDATPYSCGSLHVYSPNDRSENNIIRSHNLAFKSNGAAYPRSAVFGDRDVQLGDVAHVTYVAPGDCAVSELWSTVTGFGSDNVKSRIEPAIADSHNQATVGAVVNTVTKLAGLDSEVPTVTANALYNGLESGHVTEEYTFEVVRSSVVGCDAARLRVVSASGTDDVAEVAPSGNQANIGTRGLVVTFSDQNLLKVGQKWRVVVAQTFVAGVAVSDAYAYDTEQGSPDLLGAYAGEKNDIYVIECTKGGLYVNLPEVTVYTAKGLDFSGPTEITAKDTSFDIGTNGVKVVFTNDGGLRKGDKWYITVVSSKAGQVHEIHLKDDLSVAMRGRQCHLEMELYIKDDIQVSENRIGFAPMTNYSVEATQITLNSGVVAYHPEWTNGGVEQPLNVYSGKVYVEYREWLSTLTDTVESINDVANLDQIAGQLDPDNPLKWGVYKALSNSNGTVVKYTAVANPDSLDSWALVLERIKGRDDMYNLVPLTFDRMVQDLWAAHIGAESNEVENNWKAGFFSLKAHPVVKLAGTGVAIGGVLGNVVTDDVLATLSDDPAASGTQYTKLQVTTGNGYFVTNNVQPGDIVRYNYTVDTFGDEQYEEYVVDKVLSETTLLLYTGGDVVVTVPQRVEIHHNRTRTEIANDIAHQGGSLSSRRVCAVWPDQVGEAGTVQAGYYLSAALAGLVSGVVPHQPLTNVAVAGFDDYSRSYKYFNETQLNKLAESGVWIVTEDKDGTPYTRHALTTDNLDLNRREEMIRRNVDSMSYLFLRRLRPFIGRTNVQDGMVARLRYEISAAIDLLTTNNFTNTLGAQLTSGSIRTLQIHPLLKDRIEIVLDLVVPAPLNNIELHLVV